MNTKKHRGRVHTGGAIEPPNREREHSTKMHEGFPALFAFVHAYSRLNSGSIVPLQAKDERRMLAFTYAFLYFVVKITEPMARIQSNIVTKGLSGQIGQQVVFKQYGKKTVVSRYPDMSKIKPSKLQKKGRSRFAESVAYAQSINNDPVKKAIYAKKVKKGHTVFNFAMQEFLKGKK